MSRKKVTHGYMIRKKNTSSRDPQKKPPEGGWGVIVVPYGVKSAKHRGLGISPSQIWNSLMGVLVSRSLACLFSRP